MNKGLQNMIKIHTKTLWESKLVTNMQLYKSRIYTKFGLNPSLAILFNGSRCEHSLKGLS